MRTTPVKKATELAIDTRIISSDSTSTPTQSEVGSTKRQRRPTNRHSPSEANQQCQVLRKGENKRQIPDPPALNNNPIAVVTESKNDPYNKHH